MNLERFRRDRELHWKALEDALERARGRPDRLGAEGVLQLGRLYRSAAADLALARRAFGDDPLVRRLERLVARGRSAVYAETATERETIGGFLASGYWRRVRERPRPLATAALLLFVPMALAVVWGMGDPGAAIGALPEDFRGERASAGELGLAAGERAEFASAIFTNNLQVSFLAFAGGLLAGLGTAAVLVFNGMVVGAIAGIAIDGGQGPLFAELVLPHGLLELTCIVVTAAAGLRVGWALVEPGTRSRRAALTAEARRSVEIVLGTAPWLVLAGLVEGFVTGSGLGVGGALATGALLAGSWWILLIWRGRPEPAVEAVAEPPDQSFRAVPAPLPSGTP